jgi:hypothetical protein
MHASIGRLTSRPSVSGSHRPSARGGRRSIGMRTCRAVEARGDGVRVATRPASHRAEDAAQCRGWTVFHFPSTALFPGGCPNSNRPWAVKSWHDRGLTWLPPDHMLARAGRSVRERPSRAGRSARRASEASSLVPGASGCSSACGKQPCQRSVQQDQER